MLFVIILQMRWWWKTWQQGRSRRGKEWREGNRRQGGEDGKGGGGREGGSGGGRRQGKKARMEKYSLRQGKEDEKGNRGVEKRKCLVVLQGEGIPLFSQSVFIVAQNGSVRWRTTKQLCLPYYVHLRYHLQVIF